ncbi:MAG: hypothetical protein IKT62_05675, partial [Firmicutes bacterium]|nr:hypothetical protein [Bacillota bacterium]
MAKKLRPLDSFKRTPHRRYDLPHICLNPDRTLMTTLCAAMLLTLCNASAPLVSVPDVQTRFADWAKVHNEQTIKTLPGATPEPGSELAQALAFD